MKRVVLDSNVLISAFSMPHGIVGQIFDAWQEGRFILIISDYIINEVARILEIKMRMDMDFILHRVEALYSFAEIVEPAQIIVDTVEDNDLPILGTAVAGIADVLVTGDRVLLDLEFVQNIPIITPREFLALL